MIDIQRGMTISEILSRFPSKSQRLAQAMTNAGLHCTSCSAATWETLEAGMLGHGFAETSIQKLVDELNGILGEQLQPDTITITPKAAAKLRAFAEEEGMPNAGLRFGDTAGGCGGFQYLLEFSESAEADDATFVSEGISIFVKKGMLSRLLGCVIDHIDSLHGGGFKISNPNVSSSCGCGQSQNY